jgi:uncharacterized protein (UPF0332 family)
MRRVFTREEFAAKLGADGDPKLNAVADFAARLLNGPGGSDVARVVLFGSVAGGVAKRESDIDVMVFSSAPRKRRMSDAADAAWEATAEWGELVSPLTVPLGRLFWPFPYVVFNALKHGKEVYAMDEDAARRTEAQTLFRKAERHLEDSATIVEQGVFTLAVVGAYTAAELIAKALVLLKPGTELPYTHGGTLQTFSREYVKTGEVPRQWARQLEEKLQVRAEALYGMDVEITREDAQSVITLARDMLDFLARKLEEARSGNPD